MSRKETSLLVKKRKKETHLVQFFMVLCSEYEHICGLLLQRSPLPNVRIALSQPLATKQTQSLSKEKIIDHEHFSYIFLLHPVRSTKESTCRFSL